MPVTLLGKQLAVADLVVIGSHCLGLDLMLSTLQQSGTISKLMTIGSTGGVEAARRGECDLAGVHLLNPAGTGYNEHLLDDSLKLIKGYKRTQGVLFRKGDNRFHGKAVEEIVAPALNDASIHMVNRNQGSGTRILIDQLFKGKEAKPTGYSMQSKSHHAVAASVEHGLVDWGVAIKGVVSPALEFIPIADEEFDFVIPTSRRGKASVIKFLNTLRDPSVRERLSALGFELH